MKSSESGERTGSLLGRGFVFIGGAIAVIGFVWLVRTAIFVMTAAKAPGTVVEIAKGMPTEHGPSYYPVFTFTDAEGVSHRQQSSVGFGSAFEPGQKVTVLYDKAAPLDSNIDSFKVVWLWPLMVIGFGLAFGGIACFWLWAWTKSVQLQREKRTGLVK